ncbi:MAG: PQQ-binding-like beta-propeller repeat protein [Halolamina sp.]
MPSSTRRRLLASFAAAGVAGCLGETGGTRSESTATPTEGFPPPPPTPETPTDTEPMPTAPDWPVVGADSTRRSALDGRAVPATYELRWSFFTHGTPPVVAGDRVVAVENNREKLLVARDAETAAVEWTTALGSEAAAPPTVADGVVYVQRYTAVEAYDATTGERRWRTDLGGGAPTAPAVVDGTVYVAQGRHQSPATVAALGTDGTVAWTVEPPGEDVSAPAVGPETVAVVVDDQLLAFARDGAERWRRELAGRGARPAVDGDAVVAAGGAQVVVRTAADGAERWSTGLDGPVGNAGGVAVDADHVAVGYEGGVTLVNRADGAVAWSVATGGPSATPALDATTVYVGDAGFEDRRIRALSRSNGEVAWSIRTAKQGRSDVVEGGVRGQPVLVDGGLHVVAADGWRAIGRRE